MAILPVERRRLMQAVARRCSVGLPRVASALQRSRTGGHVATPHLSQRLSVWKQQQRQLHAAVLAPLGDAFAALPGAGKDKQGTVTIPVPDKKLERLAELERTKPVPATVQVVEVEEALLRELADAVEEFSKNGSEPPELSGKLLSSLRTSDALVVAVPCGSEASSVGPVEWLQAAEKVLVHSDLVALEQQVCTGSGADAQMDVVKLRKSLAGSKDPAVKRDADKFTKDVLVPGFEALRARLQAGTPLREARAGLQGASSSDVASLDPRFEELARGFLNMFVTWRPLLVLADVPEKDAATTSDGKLPGNGASSALAAHAQTSGIPCVTVCTALEAEVVALKEEPEFLADYLESFGLRLGGGSDSGSLKVWTSTSPHLVECLPKMFNLLTFYTAGEKEARAWMCGRVNREGAALPYSLFESTPSEPAKETGAKGGKAAKGSAAAADDDGVPAAQASCAIHTSFGARLKGFDVWKFEDLDAVGTGDSSAKDRAKAAGKVKKMPREAVVREADVVEFHLS
eukprot:TRINITY_DN59626_c0_g1_i1.p1 TRINITY_DN59626_c0_g1~~TRINITY_DN59626_c0_g1_i1.p1  ORF type:complete len:517 (-),score=147.18 TRINITY_DN59626_c0_g1_i1:131-1681(-)